MYLWFAYTLMKWKLQEECFALWWLIEKQKAEAEAEDSDP